MIAFNILGKPRRSLFLHDRIIFSEINFKQISFKFIYLIGRQKFIKASWKISSCLDGNSVLVNRRILFYGKISGAWYLEFNRNWLKLMRFSFSAKKKNYLEDLFFTSSTNINLSTFLEALISLFTRHFWILLF